MSWAVAVDSALKSPAKTDIQKRHIPKTPPTEPLARNIAIFEAYGGLRPGNRARLPQGEIIAPRKAMSVRLYWGDEQSIRQRR